MADLSKTVAIIFEGVNKTGGVIAGIDSSLKGLGTSATTAAGGVDNVSDQLDTLETKGGGVDRLAAGFRALAAAVVVKEFIDANVNAEQFLRTIELGTGSTQRAAQEYEYIRETANKLGLELQSTASAYAKFSSATQGSALEGEATRIIFEGFAGTLSAVGASADDISGALTQLSQGISKGKFELEDLKSIAERVPGFFDKFAQSLGITTAELFDLVSQGQITGAEILTFATSLQDGLGRVNFDGFVQSANRFQNALTEAYVIIGQAGVFDVLVTGVNLATAAVAGSMATLTLLLELIGALAGAIATGDFSLLGTAFDEALTKAADKTTIARDRLFGLKSELVLTGETGKETGDKIADGLDKGKLSAEAFAKASKEIDAALKALGIDPKQFKDPLDEILKAFNDIANNPAVKGEQFLSAWLVTLDKIKNGPEGVPAIEEAVKGLAAAQQNGVLSVEQYTAALAALESKTDGSWQSIVRVTDAGKEQEDQLKKQAEATRKAEEAARNYALKLEEIASNERIKTIEARIKLDIAQIENETKRIEAAFESVNAAIESTGETLSDLTGLLKGGDLGLRDWQTVNREIEKESKRRDDALKLQNELTQAQIESIQARTDALQRGESLIQIDGAGLQPHLEAFMWEILQAIQVRVNQDGLDLLLGVK